MMHLEVAVVAPLEQTLTYSLAEPTDLRLKQTNGKNILAGGSWYGWEIERSPVMFLIL